MIFLIIKEWNQEVQNKNKAIFQCIKNGKFESVDGKNIRSSDKNNTIVQK